LEEFEESDSDSEREVELASNDQLPFPKSFEILKDPNIWIADTGATHHSTFCKAGGTNKRETEVAAIGATGKAKKPELQMDIPSVVCDKYGNELSEINMTDVSCNQENNFNLFSLTCAMQSDWTLAGDSQKLEIKKGSQTIKFDIVIKTRKGALYCAYIKRKMAKETSCGNVLQEKISVAKAHALLGHANEEATRATAEHLGWSLSRGNKPCQSCAEAKAKQRNVPQSTKGIKANKPNGRLYLDLAKLKAPNEEIKQSSKPNWCIVVDECTGMKFSSFHETKDAMVEPTCVLLNKLRHETGNSIDYLRMDNAGENKALQKRMEGAEWKFQTRFEYTAQSTPQQNRAAKLGFTTVAARSRAALNHACVPRDLRHRLFPHAAMTMPKLDGLLYKSK